MAAAKVERRLAAILAADVVGYSRLMGQDEQGTLERLQVHRKEVIGPLVAEHRGRIVNMVGDSALCEFASVVDAVACAVAIQGEMAGRELDLPAAERIRFRIGVNLGDVIVEGDDLYGDGVNVAARLEGLAEPGGVCVSGKVRDELRKRLELVFAPMGRQRVKNIAEPVEAWRVVSSEGGVPLARKAFRLPGRVRTPAAAAAALLVLAAAGFGGWWWPWEGSSPRGDLPSSVPEPTRAPELEESDAAFDPDERRAIQRSLGFLGHYRGPEDGQSSYALRNAVREFQIAQGVPGTGHLTVPQTVELHRLAGYSTPPSPLPEFDAAEVLRRSEAGDPEAQRSRAMLHDTWYQDGGFPKDNRQAVRWYRQAARAGDELAALNLGWMLKDGDGVDRDPAEAARWLEIAARRDEPRALYGLAELHERGSGVARDRDRAIRLYREAARAAVGADRGIALARLRALGAWLGEPSTAARGSAAR
jgi:class 3 adenylate cyclase